MRPDYTVDAYFLARSFGTKKLVNRDGSLIIHVTEAVIPQVVPHPPNNWPVVHCVDLSILSSLHQTLTTISKTIAGLLQLPLRSVGHRLRELRAAQDQKVSVSPNS